MATRISCFLLYMIGLASASIEIQAHGGAQIFINQTSEGLSINSRLLVLGTDLLARLDLTVLPITASSGILDYDTACTINGFPVHFFPQCLLVENSTSNVVDIELHEVGPLLSAPCSNGRSKFFKASVGLRSDFGMFTTARFESYNMSGIARSADSFNQTWDIRQDGAWMSCDGQLWQVSTRSEAFKTCDLDYRCHAIRMYGAHYNKLTDSGTFQGCSNVGPLVSIVNSWVRVVKNEAHIRFSVWADTVMLGSYVTVNGRTNGPTKLVLPLDNIDTGKLLLRAESLVSDFPIATADVAVWASPRFICQ